MFCNNFKLNGPNSYTQTSFPRITQTMPDLTAMAWWLDDNALKHRLPLATAAATAAKSDTAI